MHSNVELIERFYRAFGEKDADTMAASYADDARFTDPVFPNLSADQARGMWRMLTSRARDLEITFRDAEADESKGRVHWEAIYTFTQTGRRVHNKIDAEFEFQAGRIVRHVDRFDFWRWSRMALGLPGVLLGWTPMLREKVRMNARRNLDRFLTESGVTRPPRASG